VTAALVVGVALLAHGRLLAARRTAPAEAAGRWELPGGKVEPGESPAEAAEREVAEELGCAITVTGALEGSQPIRPGLALRVLLARIDDGNPVPHEHDALRWLGPEELDAVDWLEPDRPFLTELRQRLLAGTVLPGNVGGAVRIGRTVRRGTGPWTPAVHRLLNHLAASGLRGVPKVLGQDTCGREVLSYLPGRVVDVDRELLSGGQLAELGRWTRELHTVVAGFADQGPWRFFPVGRTEIVGHNDIAPYNVCFAGDRLVGVFDWDLAGPTTRLFELAHLAWNGVPLFRPLPAAAVAHRLRLLAASYGGVDALDILRAVPPRVQLSVDGIRAGVAAGEPGMVNLAGTGEPELSERALAGLLQRVPAIEAALR
jgi:8-oxo-dGTP diphosphatase